MTEYKARLELKSKLQQELLSFIEIDDIKAEAFEYFEGKDHKEAFESFWNDKRDELIDELNDRLINTLEVIGYAHGLQLASALGLWNWEDNSLGITVRNGEDLGFVASYEYAQHYGLVYDIVDAFLEDEFEVILNQ